MSSIPSSTIAMRPCSMICKVLVLCRILSSVEPKQVTIVSATASFHVKLGVLPKSCFLLTLLLLSIPAALLLRVCYTRVGCLGL